MTDGTPFQRPVLVLNPGSGGGRHQTAIRAIALQRGWVVREVGPGADPAGLAAAADADVLLVAGGDGTVSAVAGVAVRRDLPLVVLPCGTRNHFAADTGLDITRPEAAVTAIEHGTEIRIDVGTVNDHMFLNNVSVGFYSSMVSDPQYRSRRVGLSARYVRRAVLGGGTPLSVSLDADCRVVPPQQVLTILVSNNAYSPGLAPGSSLRPRLDEGLLWVHLLGVNDRRGPIWNRVLRAAGSLLLGRAGVAVWATSFQTMWADRDRLQVGIDGEAVQLDSPLQFTCRPGALRLLLPARPASRRLNVEMTT